MVAMTVLHLKLSLVKRFSVKVDATHLVIIGTC